MEILMTRDDIQKKCSELIHTVDNLILEFGTGVGKTLSALLAAKEIGGKVKIVCAETSHIENWKLEMQKHNIDLKDVELFCYASLKKHADTSCDVLILDECHRSVSDSRAANIRSINTRKTIFLSGTIEDDVKKVIKSLYCDSCSAHWWTISTSDAINLGILPCPKIYLVDCSLDNTTRNLVYAKTKGGKKAEGLEPIVVDYSDMWTTLKSLSGKNYILHIKCTQKEYYELLSNEIEYLKKTYFAIRQPFAKNRWLHKAGERKMFIGMCKTDRIKQIMAEYADKRTICFATNIEQCEELGTSETIIHSQSSNEGDDMINDFNSEKINKLFAVKMFREGVNLQRIDAGFFVQVDNGSVSSSQVLGRVLRSEAPELYIFRMRGTVDEGYVETALERIDPKFIYDYRFRTQLVTG